MPPVSKIVIQLIGSDFAPASADKGCFGFEVILLLGVCSVSAVDMSLVSSARRQAVEQLRYLTWSVSQFVTSPKYT